MLGCLNSPEGKVTPTEMQKALIIIIIFPPLGFTNQAQGFDPWDKEKFRWVTWKKKKRNEAEALTWPTPNTTKCQITWPNQQGSHDLNLKTHSADIIWHTVAQIVWNYK